MRGFNKRSLFVGAAAISSLCAAASADVALFSGTDGGSRTAETTFESSGADLIITVANLGEDVTAPNQILTAVFFDITGGAISLTPVSAVLNAGSTVLFGGTDPGGVVGGEWEYEDSFALPAPHGAAFGVGSAGFGLFGAGLMFPGSNLQGPSSVDGLQYGITSGVDDPATGNAAVTGSNALIRNSVVFTLTGLPADFDILRIGNVNWQYGTDLSEPNIPEPASVVLLAIGGLLSLRRR
ncbi:MAG: PEP-CTERM sorting domain-containing protein [Planctomycetes bacterium]|nr:PEP-CTERM sorting domain-containing protein [Planctomycetota bacterium]